MLVGTRAIKQARIGKLCACFASCTPCHHSNASSPNIIHGSQRQLANRKFLHSNSKLHCLGGTVAHKIPEARIGKLCACFSSCASCSSTSVSSPNIIHGLQRQLNNRNSFHSNSRLHCVGEPGPSSIPEEVLVHAHQLARDYVMTNLEYDAPTAMELARSALDEKRVGELEEAMTPRQIYDLAVLMLGMGVEGTEIEADNDSAAKLALPLFMLAMHLGNDDAAYTAASLFRMGKGCQKDVDRAAEIFTRLARVGHVFATYNLGWMYLEGSGVPTSVSKAIGLFDICGKMGEHRGFYAIGQLYFDGIHRDQDYEEAIKWFEKGVEGDARCNFYLARCYSQGFGVEVDQEKAFNHHLKASDLGMPLAHYNLGYHYFTGKGTEIDLELAAHYYELAANHGISHAMINLGNMYHTGYGVKPDLEKAKECYTMALGKHDEAEKLLKTVEDKIAAGEDTKSRMTMKRPIEGSAGGFRGVLNKLFK
eukprot:m.38059 g.38059  ORF g.38059 m.38059 type:complete len:479 (-) comp9385_c0_seq2:1380-2816(-)